MGPVQVPSVMIYLRTHVVEGEHSLSQAGLCPHGGVVVWCAHTGTNTLDRQTNRGNKN